MISCKIIQGDTGIATAYYAKAFNEDGPLRADNYYANEKAGATWQGDGAKLLGIEGKEVTAKDFCAALNGVILNPVTGEIQNLADNPRGDRRRNGYDFTMAPPKSVSIAGLALGDQRVLNAHLKANDAAMKWLQEYASVIRVKDDGRNVKVNAGNLLWATVLHQTNRENEPQIHSHNVIMAVVFDHTNEKWRSLTNSALLKLRATADKVYQNELAIELKNIGYSLEYNKHSFEIQGISREQIEGFSSRKLMADEKLREAGIDPETATWKQRQMAILATRVAKMEHPRDILQAYWSERVAELGIDPAIVPKANGQETQAGLGVSAANVPSLSPDGSSSSPASPENSSSTAPRSVQSATPAQIQKASNEAVGWAISHLSEREQAFDRREIVAAALDFVKGKDIDLGALEAAIGGYVSKGELVHRESDDKFTTPRGMNAERTLLSVVASCKNKGNTVLSSLGEFDQALKAFEIRKTAELGQEFKLTSEQVTAARNILMHPDALQGVQGDAGTGKTVGLEFVKEVAESRGWQVMGMAPSANAATDLGHNTGIESETVAMFQVRHTEQLTQLQEELASLRETLKAEGLLIDGGAPVIEQQKLVVEGNQKAAWYTFDHLRGDVYKSPRTLRNQVGFFLKDVGGWPTTTNHGNDLLGRLKTSGQEVVGRLSEKLITYRPAGLAESVSAQAALAAQSGGVDPRMQAYYAKIGELKNLQHSGNTQGKPILIVMDEASMTGVQDAARIAALGSKYGARMVFQGHTEQHGSVAAGRTLLQAMRAGMHTSVLTITRRFDNAVQQLKDGLEHIRQRNFADAIRTFNRIEVSEDALVKRVGQQYQESFTALKSQGKADPVVGIVVLTNRDRKAINAEIHEVRQGMGFVAAQQVAMKHLDDPKLTQAQQRFVSVMQEKHVDAFLFSKTYRERGIKKDDLLRLVSYDVERNLVRAENAAGKAITFSPKQQDYFKPFILEDRQYAVGDQVEARWNIKDEALKVKINNGTRGVVKCVDTSGITVTWQQNSGSLELKLDSRKAMFIDHAYAHTSHKEQGATTDQTIFAVSQTGARIINQESAYVGVTRARQDTILVTSDMATIERNVGTGSKKTSAFEIPQGVLNSINVESLPDAYIRQVAAITAREQDSPADRSLATGKNESREKDKTPEKTIDRGLSL